MSQQEHQLFDHWASCRLPAPPYELSPAKQRSFDDLLSPSALQRNNGVISYTCTYPKHEFLRYVVESHGLLLHGSRNLTLPALDPIRNSSDTFAFGQQAAVYAASDGIWPICFAVLDRQVYRGAFCNECSRVELNGQQSEPFYMFALDAEGLQRHPWTDGMIYLLPRASFVPRPPDLIDGLTVHCQEWASITSVQPIAKLPVSPADFPFLDQIWGFDKQVLIDRMGTYPDLWPWGDLSDTALYPIRPRSWHLVTAHELSTVFRSREPLPSAKQDPEDHSA